MDSVSTNEKMQNRVKKGHVGVTWPNFEFLGPPNISGKNEARNIKFGTYMDGSEY